MNWSSNTNLDWNEVSPLQLPAHVYLGDSGAQLLSFIRAALAIDYTPQELHQISFWFVPILLLSVPIFNTSLVFLSRIRQRKAVYQSGLGHSTITCGYLAFIALPLAPLWANAIFATGLLVGLFLLFYLEQKDSHG
jgi:UDP-GlcNAc:undecaprenyl-phosphate GlcNAc-1-phosphate transferase